MKLRLLFFIVPIILSCNFKKKVTPEVFLIPSGYHGKILIVFDMPCGSKESFEDKKRVYIIPESGILITQFKSEFGIINQEYYFVDAKGNRTPIPKMMLQDFNEETTTQRNPNEPPRDQVGVFAWGNTFYLQRGNDPKYSGYEFFIGTYLEVRDSFSTMFGKGQEYEQYFDSLELSAIQHCK